jgi:hypothetical protein
MSHLKILTDVSQELATSIFKTVHEEKFILLGLPKGGGTIYLIQDETTSPTT